MNYKYKIRKSFGDIVADCICEGIDEGADIGELRHVGAGILWKFAKYLASFYFVFYWYGYFSH